jgi:hypothetical protein
MRDARTRRDALTAGFAVFAGCVFARPARSEPARGNNDQLKLGRALVKYGDAPGPDGHRCGDCVNFMAPAHCSLVSGEVSAGGHCLAFAPKDIGFK